MAIKQCRECGHDVSTQAKSCPNCGAARPVRHSSLPGLVVLGAAVVLVIWFQGGSTPDGSEGSASARTELTTEECMQDLQCWRDRVFSDAQYDCEKAVEDLAQYTFRWTDGLLESKFSHSRWLDQALGKITFVGDKIEYQNGYGAYQPHIYECDYDPSTETVLKAFARPGRLSQIL